MSWHDNRIVDSREMEFLKETEPGNFASLLGAWAISMTFEFGDTGVVKITGKGKSSFNVVYNLPYNIIIQQSDIQPRSRGPVDIEPIHKLL